MKDIAIVYPVAGLSSRFNGKIKQLVKVTEKETLIEYSLNQAIAAGFTKIIFVVGEKTEAPFKEIFKNNYKGIPVYYTKQEFNSLERDRPWGTADALCTIKDIIDCPFVFCNGDDIYGENNFKILIEHLKNSNENATLGYKIIDVVPELGSVHRAVFKVEGNKVKSIKETFNITKSDLKATNTKPDDLCSMNIFALHPEVVNLLYNQLKIFKKQHKGDRKIEYLIPNEISSLIEKNLISMKIYDSKDIWLGVTNPGDEEIIRKIIENNKE